MKINRYLLKLVLHLSAFVLVATAAVAFLRSRPEVDGSAVGIVGHSEGGLTAPMVAVADKSVGFLVLLAPRRCTCET